MSVFVKGAYCTYESCVHEGFVMHLCKGVCEDELCNYEIGWAFGSVCSVCVLTC